MPSSPKGTTGHQKLDFAWVWGGFLWTILKGFLAFFASFVVTLSGEILQTLFPFSLFPFHAKPGLTRPGDQK